MPGFKSTSVHPPPLAKHHQHPLKPTRPRAAGPHPVPGSASTSPNPGFATTHGRGFRPARARGDSLEPGTNASGSGSSSYYDSSGSSLFDKDSANSMASLTTDLSNSTPPVTPFGSTEGKETAIGIEFEEDEQGVEVGGETNERGEADCEAELPSSSSSFATISEQGSTEKGLSSPPPSISIIKTRSDLRLERLAGGPEPPPPSPASSSGSPFHQFAFESNPGPKFDFSLYAADLQSPPGHHNDSDASDEHEEALSAVLTPSRVPLADSVEQSVDIHAITPENMEYVMMLISLGSTQNPARVLNSLVPRSGRRGEGDAEEQDGLQTMCWSVGKRDAAEDEGYNESDSFMSDFVGSYMGRDAYETRSGPVSPPPAPKLRPMEVNDDEILLLDLDAGVGEEDGPGSWCTLSEKRLENGVETSPRRQAISVATPSSLLFGESIP